MRKILSFIFGKRPTFCLNEMCVYKDARGKNHICRIVNMSEQNKHLARIQYYNPQGAGSTMTFTVPTKKLKKIAVS